MLYEMILGLTLFIAIISCICHFLIEKKINQQTNFDKLTNKFSPKYYTYIMMIIGLAFSILLAIIMQNFAIMNIFYSLGVIYLLTCLYFVKKVRYILQPVKILSQIWMIFSYVAICVVVLIFFSVSYILIFKTMQFLKVISLTEFLALEWDPQLNNFGMLPLLFGSIIICFLALMIAVPVALLAATFTEEYLPYKWVKVLNSMMNILTAVPSIIYGAFASLYCGPKIKQICDSLGVNASLECALASAITISFMIIPFISSFISQAIKAVPHNIKEASFALGATKSETIINIIWPYITPSILSGIIIALSRAFGETMVVTMATGLTAQITFNPLESVTTLTAQIVSMFTGDQRADSIETLSGFSLGLILLLVSSSLNMLSLYFINHKKGMHV